MKYTITHHHSNGKKEYEYAKSKKEAIFLAKNVIAESVYDDDGDRICPGATSIIRNSDGALIATKNWDVKNLSWL